MESRKRAVKVSLKQQNIMVDYIYDHRKMLIKSDNLGEWTDLSRILNGVHGATKTADQWRRSLIEWKSKVKKKARTLAVSTQKTGGGTDLNEELTDTEKKLISLIGTASVLGDSELNEGGIENVLVEKQNQNLEPAELEPENFHLEFINENISSSDINRTIETIVIEVDENDVSISGPTSKEKKATKRKACAKNNYNSKKKLLASALNEYCQSTEKFTTSIDRLAGSIDRLATSNFALAESLSKQSK